MPTSCHPPPGDIATPTASENLRNEVTSLTLGLRAGDTAAADRLVPLLYPELRVIAHRLIRRERPDHTLNTTALVNEAYLRLVDQTRLSAEDRACFLYAAASTMRRVLVDYARERGAEKRGGGREPLNVDDLPLAAARRPELLLDLDEALTRLQGLNARLAKVVECRFFGGMSEEDVARSLQLNVRTVRRDWLKAKGWLSAALRGEAV